MVATELLQKLGAVRRLFPTLHQMDLGLLSELMVTQASGGTVSLHFLGVPTQKQNDLCFLWLKAQARNACFKSTTPNHLCSCGILLKRI